MFPLSSSTSNDSSSIISSSESSSSLSSPSSHLPNNTRSMEEVWNDININNIPSLPNTPLPPNHNQPPNYTTIIKNININNPTPTPTNNLRGMILQDFLNRINPPITTVDNQGFKNQQVLFGVVAKKKKRSSETNLENVDEVRRTKRMIKNRESAARSRARKQGLENVGDGPGNSIDTSMVEEKDDEENINEK